MKVYAWLSGPHEGEPDTYPLAVEAPGLGVLVGYSTRRDLVDTDNWRYIAGEHARQTGAEVKLVECTVTDTLEVIHGHGMADA